MATVHETLPLWRFSVDLGRAGTLEGLFFASYDEVNSLNGQYIYFGEVLGKHSEVEVYMTSDVIWEEKAPSRLRELMFNYFGHNVSGYNPLGYVVEECSDCGEILDECIC